MIDVTATKVEDFIEMESCIDPAYGDHSSYLMVMFKHPASVMITFRRDGKILSIMGISELREEGMRHLCTIYSKHMSENIFEVVRVARRTIDEVLETLMCTGLMYGAPKDSPTAARFSRLLGFEQILEVDGKAIYRRRK